jgi:hypothetical protein
VPIQLYITLNYFSTQMNYVAIAKGVDMEVGKLWKETDLNFVRGVEF